MKNNHLHVHFFVYLFAPIIFLLLTTAVASAQGIEGLEFPVPELGGCESPAACEAFCDDPEHIAQCVEFAKTHNLVEYEDKAEVRERVIAGGPGGCKSEAECYAYCENPEHGRECVDFAEANGFMAPEEARRARADLERGKKLGAGSGPGGCKSEESCKAFCREPAHVEECVAFGVEQGFMTKEEGERALRHGRVFTEGGPGGCRSEAECRAYCDNRDRVEECVAFGVEQGMIAPQEAERILEQARRAPRLTPENPGPGGCLEERKCHAYCEDSAHAEECIVFAETNGFMTPEEAAQARKFSRLAEVEGPGGCRGRECRDYCDAPGHEEACLDFALREGLIPAEEAAQIKKFLQISKDGGPGGCRGRECKNYCDDPGHQEECFAFAVEHDLIPPEERKQAEIGIKLERQLKAGGGPGGCRSEDECFVYCSDPAHNQECVTFVSGTAGISVEEAQAMLLEFSEKGPRERFQRGPGEFGPPRPGEFGPEGDFDVEDFNKFGPGAEGEFQRRFEAERGRQIREFNEDRAGDFRSGGGAGGFAGPGGCKNAEECFRYCTDPAHRAECAGLGTPDSSGGAGARGFFVPAQDGGTAVPSGDTATQRSGTAQTSGVTARPPSVRLQFDQRSGLYQFSLSLTEGIEEFTLVKADGSRYGGGVNCEKNYENKIINLGGYDPEQLLVRGCGGGEYAYDLIRSGDIFRTAPPGALQTQRAGAEQRAAEEVRQRTEEEARREAEEAIRREVEAEIRRQTEEAIRSGAGVPEGALPIQNSIDILRQVVPEAPIAPLEPRLPLRAAPPQSFFGAVIQAFGGLLR